MQPEIRTVAKPCQPVDGIPQLGSGIGFRRELRESILQYRAEIDFVEVVSDQFMDNPARLEELRELSRLFTVIPHGVGLSIGTEATDDTYLRALKSVSDACASPYYSEHLAMTRAPGIDIGHLSPLWFTNAQLARVADNVRQVQDLLGKPLVLENITYLFEVPSAHMRQTEFFRRLVDATGCGVLLDLTNLYTNAVNHQFDPLQFLDEFPLEKVVQLHLAGGFWADGMLIDSHSECVAQGSWDLLDELVKRTHVRACVLEQDDNFPGQFSVLLDQICRARAVLSRCPAPPEYKPNPSEAT